MKERGENLRFRLSRLDPRRIIAPSGEVSGSGLLRFVEPAIVDGDRRLIGERDQNANVFFSKGIGALVLDVENPNEVSLYLQGDHELGAYWG